MQLNSEVLPAPLGPTSPKIWPGSTAKLTACSTLMPPNCRLTSCRVSPAAMNCLSRRCRVASVCGPLPVEGRYESPPRLSTILVRVLQPSWRSRPSDAGTDYKGAVPRRFSPGVEACHTPAVRLRETDRAVDHVNVSIRRAGEVETDDVARQRRSASARRLAGGAGGVP